MKSDPEFSIRITVSVEKLIHVLVCRNSNVVIQKPVGFMENKNERTIEASTFR